MPPTRTHSSPARRKRSSPVIDTRIAAPANSGFKARWSERILSVDGPTYGWKYKHLYKPCIKEFLFPRTPSIVRPADPRGPPLELKDLKCDRTLGIGGFGMVLRTTTTRKKAASDKSGTVFALKVIRKKELRIADKTDHGKKNVERESLYAMPWSPWVASSIQYFHDDRCLYLLLEHMPQGSLRSLISQRGPFPPSEVLFYFSNLVVAMQFLESAGIVHRDLKPDNIMVDQSGYLVVVDFGTSVVPEHTVAGDWSLVGTQNYMAPEIIDAGFLNGSNFGRAVDWWSIGCILFEMLTRKMAFWCAGPEAHTFQKIVSLNYKYPPKPQIGGNIRSLVSALLTLNASQRLGVGGASSVMEHPLLNSISWSKIKRREYIPVFTPEFPNIQKKWHEMPLPVDSQVPGLPMSRPSVEKVFDNRFPKPQIQ